MRSSCWAQDRPENWEAALHPHPPQAGGTTDASDRGPTGVTAFPLSYAVGVDCSQLEQDVFPPPLVKYLFETQPILRTAWRIAFAKRDRAGRACERNLHPTEENFPNETSPVLYPRSAHDHRPWRLRRDCLRPAGTPFRHHAGGSRSTPNGYDTSGNGANAPRTAAERCPSCCHRLGAAGRRKKNFCGTRPRRPEHRLLPRNALGRWRPTHLDHRDRSNRSLLRTGRPIDADLLLDGPRARLADSSRLAGDKAGYGSFVARPLNRRRFKRVFVLRREASPNPALAGTLRRQAGAVGLGRRRQACRRLQDREIRPRELGESAALLLRIAGTATYRSGMALW